MVELNLPTGIRVRRRQRTNRRVRREGESSSLFTVLAADLALRRTSLTGGLRGERVLNTSVGARAERTLAIGVMAVRATFLVQLTLSLGDGLSRSPQPAVFAAVSAAMIVESLLFGLALWRQQAVRPRTVAVDVVLVAAVVALEPLFSSPADRVGTWTAWGFAAVTVAGLSAGAGLRRGLLVAVAALLLSGVYLAVSLPATWGRGMTTTALVNSVAILGFAAAAWVFVRFVRELALLADEARAEAVAAARNAELERQRMLLHDQATVLNWLSHTGLDPAMELALRDQAGRASQQIRAFLAAEPAPAHTVTGPEDQLLLRDVVATVAGEFHDLPLTLNVDLVRDQRLDMAVAAALAAALNTLLHNVRRHAQATSVVIHGDQLTDARWELTVQDDGVGFDPAAARRGYGLRVQAGEALGAAGLGVAVDSGIGEGTRVAITGPGTRAAS